MGDAVFPSSWALCPGERGKSESQNLEIQGRNLASEVKIWSWRQNSHFFKHRQA